MTYFKNYVLTEGPQFYNNTVQEIHQRFLHQMKDALNDRFPPERNNFPLTYWIKNIIITLSLAHFS